MDKLKMQTQDLTDKNIERIATLFPNVISEIKDENGNSKKVVDFDRLKQALSKNLVEGDDERCRLDWPGKKASLLKANKLITKTLRPCREESVNFDTTENLYIEGDNFEVLKILQESYLGKIKMIYIDPPYNRGSDLIYKDDFKESKEEYEAELGVEDEEGGKLFRNTDSNGRFHSDWLSMMYERLVVARDLMKDDGVIFISIDDNEAHNLKKICDEVFGEENFVAEFIWKCRNSLQHDEPLVSKQTERILLYTKNKGIWNYETGIAFNRIRKPFDATEYKNPDNDPRGPWLSSGKTRNDGRPSYTVVSPTGIKFTKPWIPSPAEFKRWEEAGLIWWGKDGGAIPRKKAFLKDFKGNAISDILFDEYTDEIKGENSRKRIKRWEIGTTESGTKGGKELFDKKAPFDYPKPWTLINYFVTIAATSGEIILDFFSGSATTAHAVMQLNAEDGGNRKFIMVQLPEETVEKSEAFKAGYKTIADIGKERIRRAGKKIVEELKAKNQQLEIGKEPVDASKLDIGFRVYKTDESNMKDVFYHPAELDQKQLAFLESNIKEGCTPEDLLTQVILDLGLELSLPVETKKIGKNTVFIVQTNALVACFDNDIDFKMVDAIADLKPFKVVFKDASFKDDKDRINVEERFKRLSPETKVTVI